MSIDYRFKILYAIGIIFVVIGHCGGGGINILSTVICICIWVFLQK